MARASPEFSSRTFRSFLLPIKPQIATTYEIGTRGKRPDFTWELIGYRANIRDELQCRLQRIRQLQRHQCSTAPFIRASRPASAPRCSGTSSSPRAAPDKIWLNLAYTFNDFRFDNDPTFRNNQLPGAPRHYLRAELLYKHPNGFYVGPNLEWVPESYFVDSANTLKTEPYAIWGLKAGVDNGGTYSMYVEARNIANKAYIGSASIIDRANPALPLFEPGTGRAVYAGVKARW